MPVNYVQQKCTSCGGSKLEYDPEIKAYRCMYCSTIIERHEQVNTMFTIKNVVRQALLDIAYQRFDSAQKNIVECEKIDSRYVGTLLAKIAYEMNMMMYGKIQENEKRNLFAQFKKNNQLLNEKGKTPTDEEMALYEFFDSSEAIGVLILVYDALKSSARKDCVTKFFDPAEVYSVPLNTGLISLFLKSGQFDKLDGIIKNTDNINKKSALRIVLNGYPDGEQKRINAVSLIGCDSSLNKSDAKMFEGYLSSSTDCVETKKAIAKALCQTEAKPSMQCLMETVISKLQSLEDISDMIDGIMSRKLMDIEIYTILEYALGQCSDEACAYILEKLYETKQYVEFTHNHFITVLRRSSSAEAKIRLVEAGLRFNVSEKTKETFISSYLCEVADTPESRKQMLAYLLGLIRSLSTKSVEKYLLQCSIDREAKCDVVKMLFNMQINRSFFRSTLNNYLLHSVDSPGIKKEIVFILTSVGLPVSESTVMTFLTSGKASASDKTEILRRLKQGGIRYDDLINEYLSHVSASDFESGIMAELLSDTSFVQDSCLTRYIIELPDLDAAKIGNISKMCGLCSNKAADFQCFVNDSRHQLLCNIVQAYILKSPDSLDTSVSVLETLIKQGVDPHADMNSDGIRMKFKKYISSNGCGLSEKSRQLYAECKKIAGEPKLW